MQSTVYIRAWICFKCAQVFSSAMSLFVYHLVLYPDIEYCPLSELPDPTLKGIMHFNSKYQKYEIME